MPAVKVEPWRWQMQGSEVLLLCGQSWKELKIWREFWHQTWRYRSGVSLLVFSLVLVQYSLTMLPSFLLEWQGIHCAILFWKYVIVSSILQGVQLEIGFAQKSLWTFKEYWDGKRHGDYGTMSGLWCWRRTTPRGSYICMLGPQLVNCLGRISSVAFLEGMCH